MNSKLLKVTVSYTGASRQDKETIKKDSIPFLVYVNTPPANINKRAKNLAKTQLALDFGVPEKNIVILDYDLQCETAD